MSDDELRSLERALESGGIPARLRYARALERAGRTDEFVSVLLPARTDPAVRAELSRAPAWTHPEGDAGRSHYMDVPSISPGARALWRHRTDVEQPTEDDLEDEPRFYASETLLASPLATVCFETPGAGLVALDPETGARLWSRKPTPSQPWPPTLALAEDVLLLWQRGTLTGVDLASGNDLYRVELPIGALACYALPDPRVAPSANAPLWTKALPRGGGDGVATANGVVVTWHGTRNTPGWIEFAIADAGVVVSGLGELSALDPRTGACSWRVDTLSAVPLADRTGAAAWLDDGIAVFDARGELLWREHNDLLPLALAPDFVVARSRPRNRATPTLCTLDRKSGSVTEIFKGSVDGVALARNAIAVSHDSGSVSVFTERGGSIAEFTSEELSLEGRLRLAIGAGRLFARSTGGVVVCLGS